MADQVPNCPPSTELLVKYIKEHRLQLKPSENVLFSSQYKACRESWVSKTDSNYTKPACLTHGYSRVREKERSCLHLLEGTYLKGAEDRQARLPILYKHFQESRSQKPCWIGAHWHQYPLLTGCHWHLVSHKENSLHTTQKGMWQEAYTQVRYGKY